MATSLIGARLWPIHLKPQTDELLSSWQIRFAHAHSRRADAACVALLGRGHGWNRDRDRCASDWVLGELSSFSCQPVEDLFQATLLSFAGTLSERVNARGSSFGILPLGIYHRKRKRSSLMYCPACLAATEAPYFRRVWRVAFLSACPEHALQLLDRCPRCHSPVIPHRVDMNWYKAPLSRAQLQAHRFNCFQDLRKTTATPADEQEVAGARRVTAALRAGWVDLGRGPIHSIAFFIGARALIRTQVQDPRWQGLELADLPTRRRCLIDLEQLLDRWPERFLATAKLSKWSFTRFVVPGEVLPYWLNQVIDEALSRKRALLLPSEMASICLALNKGRQVFNPLTIREVAGRYVAWRDLESYVSRTADHEVVSRLLAHVDQAWAREKCPKRRLHYLADKVMLIMMRTLGLMPVTLATLRMPAVRQTLERALPDPTQVPVTREDGLSWVSWYVKSVWPALTPDPSSEIVFWAQQSGRPLSAAAISERFRLYRKASGLLEALPSLWCLPLGPIKSSLSLN